RFSRTLGWGGFLLCKKSFGRSCRQDCGAANRFSAKAAICGSRVRSCAGKIHLFANGRSIRARIRENRVHREGWMTQQLRFRIFAHSWISDWNHGNAHFLRGLASELIKQGNEVRCYEELNGWSMQNLSAEAPDAVAGATTEFKQAFPSLDVRFYAINVGLKEFLAAELQGADVVILHEWNSPELVAGVLSLKPKWGFKALFHDTHHRAYTNPSEVLRFPLAEFDGVLAFGEAIRKIYVDGFGVKRVWTFHE